MEHRRSKKPLILFGILLGLTAPGRSYPQTVSHSPRTDPRSIVISARMQAGSLVYRLNGKRVEDTPANSLLTNLAKLVRARGARVPVIIIIDVRAPFTEVGKIETALDKTGITSTRRIYVTDFRDGTMNEILWDQKPVPLPPVH